MGTDQPALFGDSSGYGALSPMKAAMSALIDRIRAERLEADLPFTVLDEAKREIALSIALSIDRGNAKGRATANEHEQLDRLIEQLAGLPTTEDEGASNVPAPIREMMAAFAYHAPAPSRPDSASTGDDGAQP